MVSINEEHTFIAWGTSALSTFDDVDKSLAKSL